MLKHFHAKTPRTKIFSKITLEVKNQLLSLCDQAISSYENETKFQSAKNKVKEIVEIDEPVSVDKENTVELLKQACEKYIKCTADDIDQLAIINSEICRLEKQYLNDTLEELLSQDLADVMGDIVFTDKKFESIKRYADSLIEINDYKKAWHYYTIAKSLTHTKYYEYDISILSYLAKIADKVFGDVAFLC